MATPDYAVSTNPPLHPPRPTIGTAVETYGQLAAAATTWNATTQAGNVFGNLPATVPTASDPSPLYASYSGSHQSLSALCSTSASTIATMSNQTRDFEMMDSSSSHSPRPTPMGDTLGHLRQLFNSVVSSPTPQASYVFWTSVENLHAQSSALGTILKIAKIAVRAHSHSVDPWSLDEQSCSPAWVATVQDIFIKCFHAYFSPMGGEPLLASEFTCQLDINVLHYLLSAAPRTGRVRNFRFVRESIFASWFTPSSDSMTGMAFFPVFEHLADIPVANLCFAHVFALAGVLESRMLRAVIDGDPSLLGDFNTVDGLHAAVRTMYSKLVFGRGGSYRRLRKLISVDEPFTTRVLMLFPSIAHTGRNIVIYLQILTYIISTMLEIKSLQSKFTWSTQLLPLQISMLDRFFSPTTFSLPDIEPCSGWFHSLLYHILHTPAFAALRGDIEIFIQNEFRIQTSTLDSQTVLDLDSDRE